MAMQSHRKKQIKSDQIFFFRFSEYAETVKGDDAVDYGAYTGGYGAFGHYASYPNFEGIGGR